MASVGMSRTSLKPEMRRPFSRITGLSPPRPRPLRVWGASSAKRSVTELTPKDWMSAAVNWTSGLMSPTTAPGSTLCPRTVTAATVSASPSAAGAGARPGLAGGLGAAEGVGEGEGADWAHAVEEIPARRTTNRPMRRL